MGTTEIKVMRVGEAALFSPPLSDSNPIITNLFLRQVEQTPDHVAVLARDGALTYADLLEQGLRIAGVLRDRGVRPEVPVGLVGERSVHTMAALWGTLLAGGAYVPVDPETPAAYVAKQIEASNAAVVLTARKYQDLLSHCERPVLTVENLIEENAAGLPHPECRIQPNNLAYVISTSGSTGSPKAVAVSHASLSHYTNALSRRLSFSGRPEKTPLHFAMVSTLAADLGYTCLFSALTTGGCLHLIDPAICRDGHAFADYLETHAIDVLKIVPSHFAALLAAGRSVFPKKWLILGGERLTSELFRRIQQAGPRCTIVNHYGPTEATIGCVMNLIGSGSAPSNSATIPVGFPLGRTETYILDSELRPVAANVTGALYVGGDGLARGYYCRPGQTAEAFIPDPFSSTPGTRLYRTGDTARRTSDGTIEILGREDDQIKIRGHRVEPGEIECVLLESPVVSAAAVIAVASESGQQLVAFLVPRPGEPKIEDMKTRLAHDLPAALVPAHFIWIDALPLNANGKLDKHALRLHAKKHLQSNVATSKDPLNELEQKIADVWNKVLQRPETGSDDDFFQIGGDSISAIQITAKLRNAGVFMTPLQLFQHTTIRSLAAALTPEASQAVHPALTEESTSGKQQYPLSPMQQGMLFHALNGSSPDLYVSTLVCTFGEDLDPAAFTRAWQEVVKRHSIFRTSFIWDLDSDPVQVVHPELSLEIDQKDWRNRSASDRELLRHEYCAGTLDLARAPAMRMALMRVDEGYEFIWIYSHLLMDAWSERILNEELSAWYEAYASGRHLSIPLPLPYHAYVQWLQKKDWSEAKSFWTTYLQNCHEPTRVPGLIRQPELLKRESTWRSERITITAGITDKLRALSSEKRITLNDLIQGAWALLLAEYSGSDDILFGATVAGRPPELIGADSTIGPFLNTLPVRVRFPRSATLVQWLRELHEQQVAARAFDYADLIKIQSWSAIPRGTPLFETIVVFQNASLLYSNQNHRRGFALPLKDHSFRGGWTNYALSLDVEDLAELAVTLSFMKDRVGALAASQLLTCLASVLTIFSEEKQLQLNEIQRKVSAARSEHTANLRNSVASAGKSHFNQFHHRLG
ncbi:MAG TPA: amino acid adenylation domain-containing protein [Bryobacteraceae bacterium]|nr:amino acid adenylation domain-containing protein [Bryobacteraceae bacterium]